MTNHSNDKYDANPKNISEKAQKDALLKAIPLQVHRKTDFPPMNSQLSAIFAELKQLREESKKPIRKADRVKKHLDVIILDLWVAAHYYESPWRMISLNRNNYLKETRYRKIYLKYDLFKGVLDGLVSLSYADKSKYYFNRTKGKSFQTRIKASDKLLNFLDFDIKKIEHDPEAPEEETIIKKDENGNLIDYVNDRFDIKKREELKKYNELLRKTEINTDAIDLRYQYDPTSITVKRIFNGESGGGRFYGGFWENMPKEDRKKLLVNGEEVCELDYSALHPTICYATKGIQLDGDAYTIEGCERNEVKRAFLILFNCKSRKHALNTMRSEFHIKDAESLLQEIELKHSAIKNSFYNPPYGLFLQRMDSNLAEKIINYFTSKDIPCLSIHDSYIIAKSYESELRSVMEKVFSDSFHFKPRIK
ncbi:hypothetical protein [Nitrosomonas ureae]|uniref:Uncharacterized protein n=1 Tax=Nitrosomonas ureae TaxID=44577 RepID=A0A1H5SF73_9PROT|nr:hypothetical protein [Nitrosomonas ureae]SEF48451.1 hypothetical protein SAMN05216334_102124 [Nitrosomonas ureae]